MRMVHEGGSVHEGRFMRMVHEGRFMRVVHEGRFMRLRFMMVGS